MKKITLGSVILFCCFAFQGIAQTTLTCGDDFFDTGGATADYSNNANETTTISPVNAGDVVTVTFTAFDVEIGWDALYVYDGPDAASPLIDSGNPETNTGFPAGGYYGNEIPGPFQSTDPSGALTFVFMSDGSVPYPGWEAFITCGPPPSCLAPAALTATGVNATEATLGWTENDGATTWDIDIVAPGTPPSSTPSNPGITSNPYPANGLTPATDYEFYVRSHCSDGTFSNWSGPYAFTTECATFTLPFLETFDEEDTTPNCWTESGDNAWEYSLDADYAAADTEDHTPGGGTFYAWMDGSDNGDGEVSTLTSPLVDISSLAVPALEFYLFSNNIDDSAINIIDVEFYDGAAWNNVLSVNTLLGDQWQMYLIDLSTFTITGDVQVRFTVTGNDNGGSAFNNDILLDDVEFKELPSCLQPVDLTATVTATTADLGWTEQGSATTWDIEIVPAGTPPTGIPDFAGVTDNPYNVTNLDPATDYEFYVRADCGGGDLSEWSGPFEFTTECATFTVPFLETFDEEDTTPNCWTESGDNAWDYSLGAGYAAADIEDHTPGGGTFYAWMDGSDNGDGEVSTLTSPLVDISSLTDPGLEFFLFSNNTDDEAINIVDVEFYDGAAWNNVLNLTTLLGDQWTQFLFDLSGYTITGPVQVRFTVTGNDNGGSAFSNDILLDDVTFRNATCFPPIVDFEVVSDCLNAPQFFVDVDITDLGSATDLDITDNQGSPVQTVSTTGVYTFGPYPLLTPVEITVTNNQDNSCVQTSGELTLENCTENLVDCAVGPVNTVFCYDLNTMTEYYYESSDGTVLNLTVNAGQVEDGWDPFIVLDSDGTTELYNGYGTNGDLTGLSFQSSGDNLTVLVESDGINSCADQGYTSIDLTVACATCINPDATYDVVSDCASGTDQFFVDVEITSLGDATSLTIADNQGSPTQSATATGTYTFGPYPNGTDVEFTITNDQDVNCVITSSTLTQEFCPPDNDECAGAIDVPVNDEQFCVQTIAGTMQGSTLSSAPLTCGDGSTSHDVWFKFTASSTTHMISLLNETMTQTDDDFLGLDQAIYEGNCGNLTELFCNLDFADVTTPGVSRSPSVTATGLTLGETYYIRVIGSTDNEINFNVCITTPVYGENTTCAEIEPFCAPTSSTGDPEPLVFPGTYYYQGQIFAEDGPYYFCDGFPDVLDLNLPTWYYLQVQTDGDLEFEIENNTAFDANGNPIGKTLDVDFTSWGPFTSIESCDQLTMANHVPGQWQVPYDGCDYSPEPLETFAINDANAGDIYIVVIFNYDQNPGYISIRQTNFDAPGAGTTDCTILDETIYACAGTDVILTSQFPDAQAYVWYEYDPVTDTYVIIPTDPLDDSITVSEAGTYKVVSFDDTGASTEEIFTVEYSPNPIVDLGPDVSLCGQSSVTLDGTIQNPADFAAVTYVWSDANGPITPPETNPTLTVTTPGTYTVEVTGEITDADGLATGFFCTATDTIEVTSGNFTIDLGGDQTLCDEAAYQLDPTIAGADETTATYLWSTGETTPTITVSTSGTYSVTVTINGCPVTVSAQIIFGNPPLVDLGPDGSLCGASPAPITLDATPSNASEFGTLSYVWSDENGPITPPETNPTLTVTTPGTYSVEVTGTLLDANGNDTGETCTGTDEITIEDANFTIDLGGDQTLCDEATYEIDPAIAGADDTGATYLWSTGETTPAITVSADGTYTVDVTINGCTTTAAVEVTFNESPEIELGPDVETCDLTALNLTLDATPTNFPATACTFEWSLDGTVLSNETGPTLTVQGYGTYSVTVYADDPNCSTTDQLTVSEPAALGVEISTGEEDNLFCAGDPVELTTELTNAPPNGVTYQWFKDGSELTGETSPDLIITDPGTYRVEVTSGDCTATAEVEVGIEPCEIPQGISPNGDRYNQRFDLSFLAVSSIEIFNRNGRSVYGKTGGYTDQWEGQTDNGDELVTGTYYYVVKLAPGESFQGKQVLTGWVYINREIN